MSNTESTQKFYKVTVDIPNCCGYGLCATLCPEIYKLDDGGIVFLEGDSIPEEHIDAATEGAEACPAQVIQIETVEV
ncbi:ferredoxin [Pseudomaricurvus alkylphenolicus]|uniref:ferredoxin n=1 Tax=Pseudomaricurvus alkylphenolicus TaxID=1306991 RepID=UPI001423DD0B|nr:ferredoxin [Pseudomaricurvus alkylphenolicus]NIB44098.1 ferredoxin [Pseudomaricurvus alkylphenolicus]